MHKPIEQHREYWLHHIVTGRDENTNEYRLEDIFDDIFEQFNHKQDEKAGYNA